MSKDKINNNDLKLIGLKGKEELKFFGRMAKKLRLSKNLRKSEVLNLLKNILAEPEDFKEMTDETGQLAIYLLNNRKGGERVSTFQREVQLKPTPLDFEIYGRKYIEGDALQQMETAMRLPVSLAGALMPDAHTGYGLPIGGVLATSANVVIPYAVGVDIACRMCMSVFDLPTGEFEKYKTRLKESIEVNTIFGVGGKCKDHFDSSVFDHPDWKATRTIRQHRDLAFSQLGTSGAGNHFVEWGFLEIDEYSSSLNIPERKYIALLSHSGSRGFGNEIASYYSKVAMQQTKLPQGAKHLAWLTLDSEEGQEYWTAMNLAGMYASANHHEIYNKISRHLNLTPLLTLENHHNFAWKEKLPDGTEVVVHRKGATPAGINDIGIIPGSMTLPGFVIKGKGNKQSIHSASHGAGRVMSRNQAFKSYTFSDLQKQTKEFGIDLIGGDIDEAPMVYKDIYKVMEAQYELVEIVAKFYPKIVRMAEPDRRR
jgi:tRNA-splicing ligase RtcB (3'-phosphate/5'-hydroxy nucleic acid ligase)